MLIFIICLVYYSFDHLVFSLLSHTHTTVNKPSHSITVMNIKTKIGYNNTTSKDGELFWID